MVAGESGGGGNTGWDWSSRRVRGVLGFGGARRGGRRERRRGGGRDGCAGYGARVVRGTARGEGGLDLSSGLGAGGLTGGVPPRNRNTLSFRF